jgi:putative ATP-binding cassette transporter
LTEVIFFVRGNGCGKSTVLKLLTGLYVPDKGAVILDGKRVSKGRYIDYRENFSAIFSDFHLCDKFYGLEPVDRDRVRALLKLSRTNRLFSMLQYTLVLSGGQG